MKTLNTAKSHVAIAITALMLGMPSVQAQDNRVPSFWGSVSVKVMETYGNNNSKPLTGAKVILDALDAGKANAITARYPVVRFPMVKSAQTRGASFTRIPPVNDIGEYQLTVIPSAYQNKSCIPYNPPRGAVTGNDGSVSIRLRKSPGPSTTRRTFNFKCSNNKRPNRKTTQPLQKVPVQAKAPAKPSRPVKPFRLDEVRFSVPVYGDRIHPAVEALVPLCRVFKEGVQSNANEIGNTSSEIRIRRYNRNQPGRIVQQARMSLTTNIHPGKSLNQAATYNCTLYLRLAGTPGLHLYSVSSTDPRTRADGNYPLVNVVSGEINRSSARRNGGRQVITVATSKLKARGGR